MSFATYVQSGLKISVGGAAIACIIKLLHLTLRWQWYDTENFDVVKGLAQPRIWALWHRRQILNFGIYFKFRSKFPRHSAYGLISAHDDGRLIARAIGWLGMRSIKGSSSRGGSQAMIEMVRRAKEGKHIVFTPDGPKGPLSTVKDGIIRLASLSGSQITPVGLSVKHSWKIRSWDRLIIPKPFSRGVGIIGKPITIPPDLTEAEFEGWKVTLADKMNAIAARADALSQES